jgi:hypothetical protein
MYPIIHNLQLVKDETEPNTYHISEDGGKTFTMSIEWAEIYEPTKEQQDDLKGVLEGMPNLADEIQKQLLT